MPVATPPPDAALNLAGITYVHTIRYYEKGIDSQGPYYDVEYLIDDWADSDRFVNALLGIGTGAPHRYPLSPNLLCVEAGPAIGKGRPVLSASGLPGYAGGAIIPAKYRSPGVAFGGATTDLALDDPQLVHQIDPDHPIVWCTQELDFTTGSERLPDTNATWETGGAKSNVPWQQEYGVTILNLTFHRRPALPAGLIRLLRGRINSTTFLGAAAETILFVGAKTRRTWSTDGLIEQEVFMQFKERDESWNKTFRPDTGAWEYLSFAGNRFKKTADLRPLAAI